MTLQEILAQLLNPGGTQQNQLSMAGAPPAVGDHNNPALLRQAQQRLAQPPQMAQQQPQGAPPAAIAPQQAPQGQPMPQSAPQAAPAPAGPSGGGLGGLLGNLFGGRDRQVENDTAQWLAKQGYDPGTARALAGNKEVMQRILLKHSEGADPSDVLAREKFEWDKSQAATTDDIKEYQLSVKQGYAGTLPEFMKEMKKAGAQNIQVGGETMTPGWKKVDEKFAEEYIEWRGRGGFSDVRKQTAQLNDAIGILEANDGITGPMIGNLPDWASAIVNPDGTIAKDYVEEVVQRNLRLVLGAQFTEKEGERLIARAYNPRLKPAENLKRVKRLIEQIDLMAEAKEKAALHFEKNGTMMGFTGNVPSVSSLDDIDLGDEPGGDRKIRSVKDLTDEELEAIVNE